MKVYGLPAVALRTVFALLGVGALLLRDHLALATALLLVGVGGMLGLELYFRIRRLAGSEGATDVRVPPRPVWRSVETWPRRDSFLLAGLLLLVDYLLVAIFIFAHLSALGRVALALGTVPILAYTIAEIVHGVRPSQSSLRRADHLAVIAVANALVIALVVAAVGALTAQFG